jgi:hypothetical protein
MLGSSLILDLSVLLTGLTAVRALAGLKAYHLTYLPGFDKFVLTASRHGPDAWGCSDHAVGVADASLNPIEAAKEVLIGY